MSRSIFPPNSRARNERADAGFTLLEALIALAVVMISLAAIGNLASSSFRSGLHVERHLAAVAAAQMIEAGFPDRAALSSPNLSGSMSGHRWQVRSTPFQAPIIDPAAGNVWAPQTMALEVISPSGDQVRIDVIRLIKRTAQ